MNSTLNKSKKISYIALFIYGAFVAYIFFAYNIGKDSAYTYSEYIMNMHNFIPFKNIYALITAPVISVVLIQRFLINLLGNILLFIPLGILIPTCFKKIQTTKNIMLILVEITFLKEIIQLFLMVGIFDVNDILLNMLGGIIGIFIWRKISTCDFYKKVYD